MTHLSTFFGEVRDAVDRRLDELLPASEAVPTRLHEAVRWSVLAGGKRLRPALVVAVGETLGASRSSLITTAAAIEMIHSYSLIHDDLPAMDDDELRRGRATCHVKYGEATAILAGDALQSLAFGAIASDEMLTPGVQVEILRQLATAAGTPHGMVAGQQLDLDGEGVALSIDEVTQIHRGKTGAMIAAAAMAGAIIADSDSSVREAIRKYGEGLGLLFQITDDLLDLTQETAVLGKTAGKDVASQKSTFPAFYGIEGTREFARRVCSEVRESIDGLDTEGELLGEIALFVLERES